MVDEDDDFGVDLESLKQQDTEKLEEHSVDLDNYKPPPKEEPGFWENVGDVFLQTGRGALRAFTWPLDVLKLGMLGEGLSDIEDLEDAYRREGVPFDKQKYIKDVFETSNYIPTQDLLEQGFEKITGISLEPKSEIGKKVKQGAEVAALTRGGPVRRLISGSTAAATTAGLEKLGVNEDKAELAGDITGFTSGGLTKSPRVLSKEAQKLSNTAQKYALPFAEFMARAKEPFVRGRILKRTEQRLGEELGKSSDQAIKDIISGQIPISNLKNRGINLDNLAQHAYSKTRQLAQRNPAPLNTADMVTNIDKEISRLKGLAPSPSDAQKAAISLLEQERDVLKIAKPNAEQLINQHINYNANMQKIYAKPEFAGKENEVRKAYEFLKNQSVQTIEKQGHKDTANAFRASNKIYSEAAKLREAESILSEAFKGDKYDPKKLSKIIDSRKGNFLRRNLGDQAVKDIKEISEYGVKAQKNIEEFIDLGPNSIAREIRNLGQLAPFVLLPFGLKGVLLAGAVPVAKYTQGFLLTRPATRNALKLTLKHAAEGAYGLLKKDFNKLESLIDEEYGSIDNFIDSAMQEAAEESQLIDKHPRDYEH